MSEMLLYYLVCCWRTERAWYTLYLCFGGSLKSIVSLYLRLTLLQRFLYINSEPLQLFAKKFRPECLYQFLSSFVLKNAVEASKFEFFQNTSIPHTLFLYKIGACKVKQTKRRPICTIKSGGWIVFSYLMTPSRFCVVFPHFPRSYTCLYMLPSGKFVA